MDVSKIDGMLAQLRAGAALAAGKPVPSAITSTGNAGGGVDFSSVLKNSLDQVSNSQQHAAKLARDFEMGARGEPDRGNDLDAESDYFFTIYRPGTQQNCHRLSGHHEHAGIEFFLVKMRVHVNSYQF